MKNILLGLLIFALSLAVFHTYLQPEFPYTNDGENHLARFANYKIALREGQFPPRFAPNLMNHYGYPVFNFNYPLANMLSVPLSIIDFNPEYSFKLISILSYIFGLVGMYCLLKQKKHSLFTIIMGMTLFGIQPYLVNIVLFRGSIGELLAMSLLPWIVWSIEYVIQTRKSAWFTSFFIAAFLLSHNLTALMVTPWLILYTLVRLWQTKEVKLSKTLLVAFLFGIGLSLWFWLPAVAEADLTVVRVAGIVNAEPIFHFATLDQLLFGHLGFGFSYPGPVDSIGFQMGLASLFIIWIALLISGKLLIARKKISAELGFLLLCAFGIIAFQMIVTAPIWKLFPVAFIIQFPWRLSIFFSILVPLLWAETAQYYSRTLKKVLLVTCLLCVYLIAQLKPVDFFHKNQIDYDLFAQSTSTQHENRTRGFDYMEIGDWKPGPTIHGKGSASVIHWTGSQRQYSLNLEEKTFITEPTMNFAGWETHVTDSSGKTIRAKHINDGFILGRIAYELSPGQYQVKTQFTQNTWPRIAGNTISVMVLLFLVGFPIFRRYVPKKS